MAASQNKTVYIITGASRGIGRALVEIYLKRSDSVIVACVRNPSDENAKSLESLSKSTSANLIILPLDNEDNSAAAAAIKLLTTVHGIDHVDVAIANAGISQEMAPIANTSLESINRHVQVNAYGTLTFFQAVVPLLTKSTKNPRFVTLGSPLGAIAGMELRAQYPTTAYGISKAMVHFITRKVHFEHPDITSFTLEPGFVQTDMGNSGAKSAGLEKAFDTVEDCVNGIVDVVDKATREETSGRFVAAGKFAGVDGGKDFPF